MVLRTLHNYLERRGYNLLEAHDGVEALLIAECFPAMIQVLVTDLVMPRINGRELVQRLLPLRPEMQVIMMSGFADEIVAQQGLTTPLVPILQKPFLPRRLLDAIAWVLAEPQPQRTIESLALHFAIEHSLNAKA
jgi:two-component system cell cycle sensor histidine kinase/response regulator CckA